jgi:hypothetical protein
MSGDTVFHSIRAPSAPVNPGSLPIGASNSFPLAHRAAMNQRMTAVFSDRFLFST